MSKVLTKQELKEAKEFWKCSICGYEEEKTNKNSYIVCPKCTAPDGEHNAIVGSELICPRCEKRMKWKRKPYDARWKCTNIFCRAKSKNLDFSMADWYAREEKLDGILGRGSEELDELRASEVRMRVHIN